MKFEVRIGEALRTVEFERDADDLPRFQIDGRTIDADVLEVGADAYSILIDGRSFEARVQSARDGLLIQCGGEVFSIRVRDPRAWDRAQDRVLAAEGRQQVTAPMPGRVVRVLVASGEQVRTGQGLAVVEAMKMQNEIRAPKDGTVERVFVKENQTVSTGDPLVTIT